MFAQLQQFWASLSTIGKFIYGTVAVVLVGLVGGVGYWSSQPKYDVLFAKLPADGAASIVERLTADQVSYRIKAGGDGTTVLVPAEKVPELRMKLSAAGLPQNSGKGYELFDSMSMGATPFIQQMNFLRATEGEITRTILALEPIEMARVHITQPESSPFVREEKPVTASILIKTRPGKTLNRDAIRGIVQLTSHSVKGLAAENVSVIDAESSRVLSETKDSKSSSVSNDQLAYQRETETHLANNATEILTRLLGPGRAVVRVTADMSFRQVKEFSEKFDPEGKVAQREQVTSSNMTAGASARGPVGQVSNVPPAAVAPAGGVATVGPNKNDETIETHYLVSHINQEKIEQQGLIDRLTVAVILIPQKADGDALEDAFGITLEEARELVKQAVSFKEGRDQIQVSVGKAAGEPVPAAVNEVAAPDDRLVAGFPISSEYVPVIRWSALGVASLLFMAIVFKLTRRRPSRSPSPAPAFAGMAYDGRPVPEEMMDLHAVAATIKAWLDETPVIKLDQQPGGNMPQAKTA